MELTPKERTELLERIMPILSSKGIKATTMDTVASRLGMSKRTLYEIFEDKRDMVHQTLDFWGQREDRKNREIFEEGPDVLTSLARIMESQAKSMEGITATFFRDLDKVFRDLRKEYEKRREQHDEMMMQLFRQGVEEGVLRDDLNYQVQMLLLHVQMESLKRMEDLFPEGLTIAEAYRVISQSFLRSIATIKGLEILDERNKQQ